MASKRASTATSVHSAVRACDSRLESTAATNLEISVEAMAGEVLAGGLGMGV